MHDRPINFFSEEITFELSDKDKVQDWITKVIQHHQKVVGSINYIFCNDNYLHGINVSYLNHDTYTDIITFDHSENEWQIEGDIYISVERVRENADTLSTHFEEELKRVIIHGVLHLIGYEDKSDPQKEKMRKMEEKCLTMYV